MKNCTASISKAMVLFLLSFLIIAFIGCDTQTDISSTSSTSSHKYSSVPDGFIDEYITLYDYDDFNSPASENGLSGSLVYCVGTLEKIDIYESNDETLGNLYVGTVDSRDGKWTVFLDYENLSLNNDYSNCIDSIVVVCGTYSGYSDKTKLPVIVMDKMFSTYIGEVRSVASVLLKYNDSDTTTSEQNSTSSAIPLGMKNAVQEALDYLDSLAFSREGLIHQLEYEGYSHEEAVYGVDNCGADWYEQAVLMAINYIDYSAFSESRLIKQLEYEDFTNEEAVYGVKNCGADWYEQAVLMARSYLDYSSFSKSSLIKQLEYEGFTQDQAEYAANQMGY